MVQIKDGQCGMCAHYGDNNPAEAKLIQIRVKHEAPETLIEECGHPQLAPLHLVVTANSGCAGFQPVTAER
jgi:hypothetical protein